MEKKPEFPLTDFLPYLLNRAAEESSAAFSKVYKDRFGLLRTEWRVLFHLGEFGALTATQIGLRSKIHKTKISRAVAALEKRRLLTKARQQKDRRRECLKLTPAGQKIFEALVAAAKSYNDQLLAPLSPPERDMLLRYLQRLID